MLQKVMSGFTTSISKFKANPSAVLAQSGGEAVAVSSHNEIQFYAVPANQYELMMDYIGGSLDSLRASSAVREPGMPSRVITSRFIAAQLAGSCRIEGLKVTAEEELLMQNVIDGSVDAEAQIDGIIKNFHAK